MVMKDRSNYIVKRLRNIPRLSPKQEEELIIGAKKGDAQAKKKLIEANLKHVIKIAEKYKDKGISFDDLIQQGSIGLIKAIEKFDSTKGSKFPTFAAHYIRYAIVDAFEKSGLLSFSDREVKVRYKFKKIREKLFGSLGREPTSEEIAEKMHISKIKAVELQKEADLEVISIIQDYSGETSGEECSGLQPIKKPFISGLAIDAFNKALNALPERQRKVLILRFGLQDGHERSLGEIAKELSLSNEAVRKIVANGLRKLSRPKLDNKISKSWFRKSV
ncbi:sigma-70 family RNA polymerase sigma factor [Candidatus Omnitrophota bacterium]